MFDPEGYPQVNVVTSSENRGQVYTLDRIIMCVLINNIFEDFSIVKSIDLTHITFVVSKFKELNDIEKGIIYSGLEVNFSDSTYGKEDSIANYKDLKKILDSMKELVPPENRIE